MVMLAGVNDTLNEEFGEGEPRICGEERFIVAFRFPVSSATVSVALDPESIVTEFGSTYKEKLGNTTSTIVVKL